MSRLHREGRPCAIDVAYDPQGRLIDEVDPRSLFTTYVYDATDNLTSTTDRLGRTDTGDKSLLLFSRLSP